MRGVAAGGRYGARHDPIRALRSETVRVKDDAETDVLTVELHSGPVDSSEEERSGVILDHDAEGRLVAISEYNNRFNRQQTLDCNK